MGSRRRSEPSNASRTRKRGTDVLDATNSASKRTKQRQQNSRDKFTETTRLSPSNAGTQSTQTYAKGKRKTPQGSKPKTGLTPSRQAQASTAKNSAGLPRRGKKKFESKEGEGEQVVDDVIEELKSLVNSSSSKRSKKSSKKDIGEILDAIQEVERAESQQDEPSGSVDSEEIDSAESISSEERVDGNNVSAGDGLSTEVDAPEDESDTGTDDLARHIEDLEDLKTSDPSFYKYLEENDADLLRIEEEESDVDDNGNEAEDRDSEDDGRMVDDDGASLIESSSTEDDYLAEARAAAEAGIDDDAGIVEVLENESGHSSSCDEPKSDKAALKSNMTVRFIDMDTLKALERQLELSRGSIKAAKELMRIFRAGRHIGEFVQSKGLSKAELTSTGSASNAKRRKSRSEQIDTADPLADIDENENDDISNAKQKVVSGGDVKFATARVYQKAMYMATIQVQNSLDRCLGKPKNDSGSLSSRWTPREHKRWKNLEPIFTSFVNQMIALTTTMRDAATLRFLLKRLELLVPYSRGDLRLAKRILKVAHRYWAAEDRDVDQATKLRAYLLIRVVASEKANIDIVLRAVYNTYCNTVARVCNPKTLPNIMFAAKCTVDLFGVEMSASYTVAFSYLREMAVTLRSVLQAKDQRTEADKVHNWSYVNALRLWSMVLSTYGAENELRPLIYPYVQISIGVMLVHPTPRTYPLRLQIASFLTNIVRGTGIYIPVAAHLLPVLRCSELKRVPARGVTKQLEWRTLLRVNDEVVKTKPFLTGLLNGIVLQLSSFYAAISRHVSFPEVSLQGAIVVRAFSKEAKVAEWRQIASTLGNKLRENAKLVADARARVDFGPQGAVSEEGMLACVPGLDTAMKTPIQRLYDVELERTRREESMRDQDAKSGDDGDREELSS